MAVYLGVLTCWLCWLLLALFSGTARARSMEGEVRNRLIGMPSRLPLLLLLSSLCFLGFCSGRAFAEDDWVLPDNYVQVMESIDPSSEYVSIENDRAVVKSLSSDRSVVEGLPDGGPWYEILQDMLGTSQTQDMVTVEMMHHLAFYYYEYPDKRDKIPLRLTRQYDEFGRQRYRLQDCSSYGEWVRLNGYYTNPATNTLILGNFTLVTLNGGASWSSYSTDYQTYWKEWYEYYNGTPSSGGAVVLTGQPLPMPSTLTLSYYPNGTSTDSQLRGTYTYVTKNDNFDYMNNKAQQEGYQYWFALYGYGSQSTSNRDLCIYMCKQPIIITEQTGNSEGYLKIETPGGYYGANIINKSATQDGNNLRITLAGIQDVTSSVQSRMYYYKRPLYVSGMSYSGGGSNEPVPSPGPGPAPTVPGPTVTNVSSPTYNQNTYNNSTQTTYNVTQTDVDLQPVIDAISIVNQTGQNINASLNELDINMQEGIDGLYDMLFDWFTALKQLIESWYQSWADWSELVYKDLQYYLDQIVYVLYQMLELQQNPVVLPSNPEQVTINFNNATDRLSTKFPFSIPWDIKLMLTLLAQPAQAPEFDFPVLMTEYTVHIDMSPLDPMADVLRFFSVIFFASGLLMVTRKLIDF